MKVNKLIVSALTILSVSTMGLATVASNADTALAKTKAAKIVKTTTYKAKHKVHVTKGNMYSTAKLTKVSHKAKNYKRTTFYRIKKAKVVKSNKKKAVYNYVKSTNGKTKGWIWHGYVKNGKAPKAKTSKTKSSLSKKQQFNKMFAGIKKEEMQGHVDKLISFLLTKGNKHSGSLIDNKGNLKVANGTKKYLLDNPIYAGTLANGHRILGMTDKPQYNFEVMPGLYSNSESFSNNSGHWVIYYISGNGDDGVAASPHKGFKYFGDLDQQIAGNMKGAWMDVYSSNDATLYNWKSKILLVNKKAAENRKYLNY
ncbi:hypothetical protein [Levilactobacillus yonginensis]|uniref:hypothetical protein n=1 Tax=Levilactobacillus yonginensis TaxID=1054041 RepID=UPI000F78EB44|nr:hypothetical protein [Levilactobacillus yonginensis]